MDKKTFREKIRKGILEYHADPVIKARLQERYKSKREEKNKLKYCLNNDSWLILKS